jgi:hypothetical protein
MIQNRVFFIFLVVLGLVVLATGGGWLSGRLALPAKGPVTPPPAPPTPETTAAAPLRTTASAIQRVPESPEQTARIARAVGLESEWALIQEAALRGVAEADQPAALATLADTYGEAMAEATAAREALQPEAEDGPPALVGAEAMRLRFEAVRRSLIDEGLSLEEAESRIQPGRPAP